MMSERPKPLLYTIYFIYFFCGLTMCFEGVFLPEFKTYFDLNYEQQMYTMLAKNLPFLFAAVIGHFIDRIGYQRCMIVAMVLFAAGTFLLVPGLGTRRYEVVLLGFLVLGIGFNFELVSGNPMLSALGPSEGASSRLNLGNALGAVAQIIAPATLSFIIPAAVTTVEGKLPYMQGLFCVLAAVLLGVSALTAFMPNAMEVPQRDVRAAPSQIWRDRKLLVGFAVIFVVLGAEAGLFGLYRNFLEDPGIAGLTPPESQRLFTLYFALFAAGRLAASWIQTRVQPAVHLIASGLAAALCLGIAILAKGIIAVVAVTALGLFVSIFFPTLYALAIRGMGERTGPASGLLTMGFVGCAILPVVQGRLADLVGLQQSYWLAVAAYLVAVAYALWVRDRSRGHLDSTMPSVIDHDLKER